MAQLAELYQRIREDASSHNHRRLMVLSGSPEWCREAAFSLLESENCYWIGNNAPERACALTSNHAHRLLGKTVDQLVLDAWDGFNPNTFGQIAGALNGGGVLILLCPNLEQWPEYADPELNNLIPSSSSADAVGTRFISHLVMMLEDDAYTLIIREGQAEFSGVEVELPELSRADSDRTEAVPPSRTYDQQQAVELILSQFRRGRRPVLLTADRGRGKSVALGIAAAQLSGFDYNQIFVTAPSYSAVETLFEFAHQLLPDYSFESGLLRKGDHFIRFLEPEQALQQEGEGQVLLVDEAAAIPVPMLKRLLQHFPRTAFSSTVHGYEGTGRGFSLKFCQLLQQTFPQTRSLHLQQPIRWAEDDPLEKLVFDSLLLNAEAADGAALLSTLTESEVEITKLDRDQLTEDYGTLKQLFGLLVMAHYRTTPGDLRILLDSPGLHIWLAKVGNEVAGALLVAEEGPVDLDLAAGVWSGIRRPKGDLLPQTLIGQEGYREAAELRCGRIMRIAVHPVLQRRGIGEQLLATLSSAADQVGWDYLGSSFAVTDELLQFWQQSGYQMIRFGSQRDPVTGCHSGLVLQAHSQSGKALLQIMQQRFSEQVGLRLGDDLCLLEAELACYLLHQCQSGTELSSHDLSDLSAFAEHNRSYESCVHPIHKLLLQVTRQSGYAQLEGLLKKEGFTLLLQKSVQMRSWQQLQQSGQGRKQMMKVLRGIVAELLKRTQKG